MMGGGAQSDTLTVCLCQEKKVTCPLNGNTNDTWPMSECCNNSLLRTGQTGRSSFAKSHKSRN